MKTLSHDLYHALLAGARTSVEGYWEGYWAGTFEPCRDEHGNVGWQSLDRQGRLIGWLDSRGNYGDPHDLGCRTWELCQVTPAHITALKLASQPWLPCPHKWR